jgi:hypothetical protein
MVYVSFVSLGVSLASLLIWFLKSVGVFVNFQISNLILMGLIVLCIKLASVFNHFLNKIGHKTAFQYVKLSTIVFFSGVLNIIFSGLDTPVNISFLIPPVFLYLGSKHPKIFDGISPLSFNGLALTVFAQILSIALLIKLTGVFEFDFLIAIVIWGVLVKLTQKLSENNKDNLPKSLGLLHPIIILWVSINVCYQLVPFSTNLSMAALILGVISIMGFSIYLTKSFGPSPEKWYGVIKLMLFIWGMSFLVDLDPRVLTAKFENLDSHFWFHVRNGLDPFFYEKKFFIDAYPTEGIIWEVFLPRIWFEYLNQDLASYFLLLFSLGIIAYLSYIFILKSLFVDEIKFTSLNAYLLAFLIAISNIGLIHCYYPHVFAWCILERAPVAFLCTLCFIFFIKKQNDPSSNLVLMKISATLLGMTHFFSLLWETSYGFASLAALGGVFVFMWRRIKFKKYVIGGGVFTLFFFLWIYNIPSKSFLFDFPKFLITYGMNYVDPSGQYHILETLFKDNIFRQIYHWIPPMAFSVFGYFLIKKELRKKIPIISCYLISFTFFLYLSRGSKLMESIFRPNALYAMHHQAFALILFIPFLISIAPLISKLFKWDDLAEVRKKMSLVIILITLVTGIFQTFIPRSSRSLLASKQVSLSKGRAGLTQFFEYHHPHSWGIPAVISSYYSLKLPSGQMKKGIKQGQCFVPYSEWSAERKKIIRKSDIW